MTMRNSWSRILVAAAVAACTLGVSPDASAGKKRRANSAENKAEAEEYCAKVKNDYKECYVRRAGTVGANCSKKGYKTAKKFGGKGKNYAACTKSLRRVSAAPTPNTDDIKVMSFNVRVDNKEARKLMGKYDDRLARMIKTIRHHNPDIIGLQEVERKTWEKIRNPLTDYVGMFVERGKKEGVAILARRSRFIWEEENSKNFSARDRQKANGCKKPAVSKRGDRIAVRVKLKDRRTSEVLDVFNTHFPSAKGSETVKCEKVGMAKLLRSYVRAFGDNVLLMGDFNTGVSPGGSTSEGFKALTKDGYLLETYVETHNVKQKGVPFLTSVKDDDPRNRVGGKIDHIFTAPAFDIKSASIDRGMFKGSTRVDCTENARDLDSKGRQSVCRSGGRSYRLAPLPGGDLVTYSDHWAIVAVVNRRPCAKTKCAATDRPRGITNIKLPTQSRQCGNLRTCSQGCTSGHYCSNGCCMPRVR